MFDVPLFPLPDSLDQGLIGYWPFRDRTARDYCTQGTRHHGTLANIAGFTEGFEPGPFGVGGAFLFNGTNSQIDCGAVPIPTKQFSISLWFRYNATPSGERFMANSHTDVDHSGFQFYAFQFGNQPIFFDVGDGTTYTTVQDPGPTVGGVWYHFVGTFNGNLPRQALYKNGIQTALYTAGVTQMAAGAANFGIGVSLSIGSFFPGRISAVRLYNRELTAGEAWALYQRGRQWPQVDLLDVFRVPVAAAPVVIKGSTLPIMGVG